MKQNEKEIDKDKYLTRVKLNNFKEQYANYNKYPKNLQKIAYRIIEHCFFYFLKPNCPKVKLIDLSDNKNIDLNDLFLKEIDKNKNTDTFSINSDVFNVDIYKLYFSDENEHKISFCANKREEW